MEALPHIGWNFIFVGVVILFIWLAVVLTRGSGTTKSRRKRREQPHYSPLVGAVARAGRAIERAGGDREKILTMKGEFNDKWERECDSEEAAWRREQLDEIIKDILRKGL